MSTSLCLCCFQTLFLNNSDAFLCSLQLFLPGDSPELKETTQSFASICAATVFACALYSVLYSFSHVAPYLGNCICPAPQASFLPRRCFSLWCQVEASAEGVGAGLYEKLLFDVPSVA